MIEIADTSRNKIQEILDKNPGKHLRLSMVGDGCAGPYLEVSLDEAGENEDIIDAGGIEFMVSDYVKRIAEVTTIKIFMNHLEKVLT
jgi:Fe-S cluster assembly iron-binding protein IscA